MEGGHLNPSNSKFSKSGSAGVPLTSSNELTQASNIRTSGTRPLVPSRSMPSPALPLRDDKDGACSNKPRNKSKVVDDSGSSNINSINNGKTGDTNSTVQGEAGAPREQDRYLPIANVIRLMRKILPTHAKISDDTKESVQECVSEFIGFITSEANERCRLEQRKTITAEDLLCSMAKLGFDDYIGPLTLYLQRYRDAEGSIRGSLRGDCLPPIKRTASDAGLYMPQHQPPPPQYPFMSPNNPHNPCFLQPQALFPGGGGSSFAAMEHGQPPMGPTTMNYLFSDMQPSRAYRAATASGEVGVQPPRAYRTTPYRECAPAPAPAPAPAAYRDAHMYMDMAGASSSSQAADPSQQSPFPGFDPYSANK
ncbi:hypothetical protein Taro_013528 [Colocasia esculenta]|uniref:Transcription factor CBF/NF-Y/archaeal histone domain-containing protein n=1 Tax=Colocasia esculenta TaxID=4460 RepID=A0A843UIZ6_COLES|nr:hypothetical protein [Colocasia esculenta]